MAGHNVTQWMSLAPTSNNPKIFLKAELYEEKYYSVKKQRKNITTITNTSRINFPKNRTFLKQD